MLHKGDVLAVNIPHFDGDIEPVEMDIDIVYEDDDIVIINKSPFLAMHPTHNHQGDTLANALVHHLIKEGKPTVFRAVGRLDKGTSGLVVCALFIVVIVILNLLLKGWVSVVDDIGFFRAVDGFIATTLYIAIAVAICLAIFAVFALLAKYNVWNIGNLIPENSLVSELFDTARAYVDPIMRKVTGLLSKLKK
jgi:hypothetical protein